MYNIKVVINGEEFPVGYSFLRQFADNFPQHIKYAGLAKSLVKLKNPPLVALLFHNASSELDSSEMDELWEIGDLSVWRTMADEPFFVASLTDSQIREIIRRNDAKVLKRIAKNIQHLLQLELKYKGIERRASQEMIDTLLNHLRNSPIREVKATIMNNQFLPEAMKPVFKDYMEAGIYEFPHERLKTMTEADFKYLEYMDRDQLIRLSEGLYELENKRIKKKVVEYLCTHPNTEVRYQMAKNRSLRGLARKMLENDPEKDIAEIARNEED